MQWIRYRTKHAWGLSSPMYCLEKDFDVEEICDGYSYSDKFRGVEYEVVELKDLPDDVLSMEIASHRIAVAVYSEILFALLKEDSRRKLNVSKSDI